MTTEDGNFTIVFNGEIYNYVELSQKSKVKSQKLRSNSDTEIILNLYAQYGKDCLQLLRGMFAFAIWDDQEKTLFAARDRFGIKPFYYLHDENPPDGEAGFIFSSELKAIKHYKGNLTINNDALDAFLRTGSVPAPLTIYNEAASLLPGNYLTINNSKCTINNYWKFEEMMVDGKWLMDDGKKVLDSRLSDGEAGLRGNDKQEERSGHTSMAVPLSMTRDQDQGSRTKYQPRKLKYDSEAKKKIRTALLDSVHAHMVSDVEVGAFLSGGIDSTAIVSLMRQCGQEKIKTVSVVFPGNKLDESKYARLAAKTYNTEHIEIPFYEKDLLDDFENIMAVMDQPTIDGINTYFVSKAAKQAGLKVVLSGLGGDELFGGYPSFNLIPKYQRIKNLPFAKMFMKFAAPLLKNKLPAKAIHYMKNPAEPNAEYKLVRGLFTESELQSLGWISAIQNSKLKIKNSLNDSSSAPGTMPSALRPPSTNNPMTMNDSISNGAMTNDYPHFEYAQCDKEAEGISGLVKVSYLESCFYMRNQLLRDSDVFSMAHSIELRVPFVDHLLYEAVLPYLDSVYDKNFPKKMLVEAVGDIPDEIVNRPKMGFTFPFEDWIRNGQLKDLMNLPKASLREKNKDLNNSLYIDHSTLYIEKLHWSRLWALFIMNRWKGNN
jgi:asparagine synthase (glutamine-hydrolysing)